LTLADDVALGVEGDLDITVLLAGGRLPLRAADLVHVGDLIVAELLQPLARLGGIECSTGRR